MDILVVDDTIENLKLLIEVLHDHNISCSRSGEEALSLLKEEEYDLILLDIMMPGMDGYMTCTELRKLPKHLETPVIFLTAKSDNESVIKGFDAGGQDYIVKPFNTQELRARVKSQLLYKQYQTELKAKIFLEREKNKAKDLILSQQSKMAQMGESFSMMAHQWRQPLSAIAAISNNLQTQVMLSTLQEEDLLQSLNNINESVTHLNKTINDYKSFFKPKYEFEVTNPRNILQKVLLLHQYGLNQNGVVLNLHIPNEDLVFKTLINELIQVFLVIIQNSIDSFLEKETNGVIDLYMEQKNNNLILRVCDNGGGVLEKDLPYIFDLNYTSKGDKGSGIGLYMVKQIIQNHLHGSIEVSNKEFGAEFVIELPLEPELNQQTTV